MDETMGNEPVAEQISVGRTSNGKMLLIVASGVLILCVLFSLLPALFAPVSADDRYWSIDTPARFDSYLDVIVGTWQDNAAFIEAGRVSTLGRLARRLVQQAVFDVSRLSSISLVSSLAAAKFLLLAAGFLSLLAFVRAIRWRTSDGGLVGLGRSSLITIGATLVALIASGVQAHAHFRNGWISYAAHTYLAITIIFGTAAASVVFARRVAEARPWAVPLGVAASVVFAVLWNWTYELDHLGLPLALFAIMAFPLAPDHRSAAQRRARLIVGGTLGTTWVVVFAATRLFLAGVCTADECYVGTSLSLGPEVLRTGWFNLASSLPGSSGAVFLEDLDSLGSSHLWSEGTLGNLWVVGALMGLSLFIIWRRANRLWPVAEGPCRSERSMLLLAAVGAVGVALGGALIMSLSVQAQEVISRVGLPYRHTALTWTSIALAVALVGQALYRTGSRALKVTAVVAVVGIVTATSAFTLPRNLVSTQAYRVTPANRALADIHWELIAGDLTSEGDDRRCQAFERAETHVNNPWLPQRLQPSANTLFIRLHGEPFCTTWQPDGQ